MKQKKILIISYTYPPNPGVGGIRIKNIACYLNNRGYLTYVLTTKLPYLLKDDNNNIIQTDELLSSNQKLRDNIFFSNSILDFLLGISVFEKVIRYIKYFYYFPDRYKWWYKYALPKAEKLFSKHKFDIVISSSIPIVAHFVTAKLKKKYKFYWIAEFRDLWTYNHYYPTDFIYTFFSKRIERKVLKFSDSLVTVSPPLAKNLAKIHPSKPITVITNGFEPIEQVIDKLDDYFTITYTGTLYEGRRDPTLLFSSVKKLIKENKIDCEKIKIRFYGPHDGWLDKLITKFSLEDIVCQCGNIDRDGILKIQASSQLLLLLMYDHPEEKGVYTAKVFEYLNARRPIIALGRKDSVINDLLANTKTGLISNNENEIRNYLVHAYEQFVKTGSVQYNGVNEEIMKYSFDKLILKYISIFKA